MAFTRAPEYNTHQTRFVPVFQAPVGHNVTSPVYQPVPYQDMVLQRYGDAFSAYNIPPLYVDTTINAALASYYGGVAVTARGAHTPEHFAWSSGTGIYSEEIVVAYNSDIHVVHPQFGRIYTRTTLANTPFVVKFADYTVGPTRYIACTNLDLFSTNIVYLSMGGYVVDTVTTPSNQILPDIVFLDGYLFTASFPNNNAGQRIYNSDLGDPRVWNHSTDFIDAEMHGDPLVGIEKHHNHLVAFGSNSIEFYFNAANELGSPLSRQTAYSLPIGTYAHLYYGYNPKIVLNDVIYFVGMSRAQVVGIFKIENFKLQKISPDWLDMELARQNPVNRAGRSSPPSISYGKYLGKEGIEIRLGSANVPLMSDRYFFDPQTAQWSRMTVNLLDGDSFSSPMSPFFLKTTVDTSTSNDFIYWRRQDFEIDALADPGIGLQSCQWITEYLDFDTHHNKHFYSVEILGSFGTNTVTMSVEDNKRIGSPVTEQIVEQKIQTDGVLHNHPVIFRNVGNFRAPRFKFSISGKDPVRLDGIMVKYNMGNR